ncbi:MAG: DUF167 domain-containing protein [Deltaproteobacteria bacterium]|nr:DUF167 domain-containing protein [Deltaproteobacteria bacterium]
MAKAKLKVLFPDAPAQELRRRLILLFKEKDGALRFWIRAKPGASKEFLKFKDDKLVLSLRAQPVDGQANEAIVAALSGVMGISKSRIDIRVGEKSRDKEIQIECFSVEECVSQLLKKS